MWHRPLPVATLALALACRAGPTGEGLPSPVGDISSTSLALPENARLIASAGAEGDCFGGAVAGAGDLDGDESGAAYLFHGCLDADGCAADTAADSGTPGDSGAPPGPGCEGCASSGTPVGWTLLIWPLVGVLQRRRICVRRYHSRVASP